MTGSTITRQTMKLSEAKQQFSRVVNRVFHRETRILVEKSGIPVAAIVSIEDLRRLEQLDAEWERDFAVFHEIGAAFADSSSEEIERGAAEAVAQARAELRAERAARGGE